MRTHVIKMPWPRSGHPSKVASQRFTWADGAAYGALLAYLSFDLYCNLSDTFKLENLSTNTARCLKSRSEEPARLPGRGGHCLLHI